MTTAEHCIATIGLNAYLNKQSCNHLIILSSSERLFASHGSSCCIEPIAALHLTVDDCISHVYCIYSHNDDWVWLSESDVTSYVSM